MGPDISVAARWQQGQTLLVAMLVMGVLCGMVALAVDVGLLFEDRRQLQNSADAMALAGVQELPMRPGTARQKAQDWATRNGIDSTQIKAINVTTTNYPNDTLQVEVEEEFEWIFGAVLGLTSSDVNAEAAARVGSLTGGNNMMPWSILQGDSDCLDAQGKPLFAANCSVKVGAQSKYGGGWRGALDFDGNGGGANDYRDNIIDGTTDTYYCIDGQVVSPCDTSVVDIENGNVVGPTEQGLEGRLAQGPECDTNGNNKDDFDEVFEPTGQVSPAYTVACPDSPWLIIIPIVEYDGGQTVTIKGWALAYVKTYGCLATSAPGAGSQAAVFAGEPAGIGGDSKTTAVDKPCNHNTQPEHDASEHAFVMAWEPGMPVPAAVHPACHKGKQHGSSAPCATPTPTPGPTPTSSPSPTPSPTPTPTPAPSITPTPSPGPSSTPSPTPGSCGGNGHYEVQIQIADATYSQSEGFVGAYNPAAGVVVRRLIK